jgi:putative ABC transport system permease protein
MPRDQHYLGAVARLKPGVSLDRAEDQLNSVARAMTLEYPETNRGWSVRLSPLQAETVGAAGQVLWVLLAAVGLLLFVASANVALLSIIRELDRSTDTAIRVALGASTGRLIREFLVESALLASLGGVLGAVIFLAGMRLLPAVAPDLPRLGEVTADSRVLLFGLVLTVMSAVVSGLPQAWRRSRAEPCDALTAGSFRTTTVRGGALFRDAIVVGQVAVAVVLLVGSGLLVRSFLSLRAVDPGFDARGVLVGPIFLDNQAYKSGDHSRAYYRALFERLTAIPGVTAVGGATTVPTSPLGPDFQRPVWPEGTAPDGALRVPASVRIVTPGYFPALRIRIADGRPIDDRDGASSTPVVMVNETLAAKVWPGGRAVGRRLVVDYSTAGTFPYEVVGVVGDLRFRGPRSAPEPEIYLAHAQRPYLIMNVVLRSSGAAMAVVPAVRAALREVDAQKPAHGPYLLTSLLAATYARDRQAMSVLLGFAGTATFLSMLGVYGVLSQRVRDRRQEIGIRMAMGASRSRVVAWVGGLGMRLIVVGLAAGLVIAWIVGGTLSGMLYGVAPTDMMTMAVAAGVLTGVGLVAALLPSWRATRIDPVAILRRG